MHGNHIYGDLSKPASNLITVFEQLDSLIDRVWIHGFFLVSGLIQRNLVMETRIKNKQRTKGI